MLSNSYLVNVFSFNRSNYQRVIESIRLCAALLTLFGIENSIKGKLDRNGTSNEWLASALLRILLSYTLWSAARALRASTASSCPNRITASPQRSAATRSRGDVLRGQVGARASTARRPAKGTRAHLIKEALLTSCVARWSTLCCRFWRWQAVARCHSHKECQW